MSTVGPNRKQIEEYISKQLMEDILADKLSSEEFTDPFTGKPAK